MKEIKEMQAGNMYLLSGKCTANSVYFESECQVVKWMKYVDNYFRGYAVINAYLNTKDGWKMVITLGSKEEIFSSYKKRLKKSKVSKKTEPFTEVWRVFSEQMRMLLSRYVKSTNRESGREGSKVKCSYKRYYFETVKEGQEYLKKMEEQNIDMSQPVETYKGKDDHFRFSKKELKGHVFMCVKALRNEVNRVLLGMDCLCLLALKGLVLQKLIDSTKFAHYPT